MTATWTGWPVSKKVTALQLASMLKLLLDAVENLKTAGVKQVVIAKFVPQKRFLFFKKKAHFVERGKAWHLGVLLLAENGKLFSAGESTRAVPPGYPGHTSGERERRRVYTKAAHESGFELGQVVFFDSPEIVLVSSGDAEVEGATNIEGATSDEGATPNPADQNTIEPLIISDDGEILVRWNKHAATENAIPLEKYMLEQIELHS